MSSNSPVPVLVSSDVTAAIGFFLTLTGLIGTFFYIHLSTWLREMLELKSKCDLNAVGDSEPRKQGRLECRFQLRRLLNHLPLVISAVISVFIVLMVGLGSRLIAACTPEPAVAPYYRAAATYFLWVYFAMTVYLLIHGYWVGLLVRAKLRKAGA